MRYPYTLSNKAFLTFIGVMLALVVVLSVVNAQEHPQPDVQLRVSPAELQVIGDALGTQPFNKVAPLLQKLQAQVIAQQPKPEAPKAEPKK